MYDVATVRSAFPALVDGAAHFDGPGGSQVPTPVAAAVAATLTAPIANRGTVTPAARHAEHVVGEARTAMADLLGADPRGIVFGRSMTQLTYDFARTLSSSWRPGDEVVVTRLDHDANIRPWVQAAQAVGATVRWADFDPDTGELATEQVTAVLGERTKLLAVTGASNLIGTRPDLPAITAAAHAVGALTYVDGVHLTPHVPIDVAAMGADLFACSPYKFLGPHCGVVAGRPELLKSLHPAKLLPSTNDVPERFELGTLPYELLAGTTAAVDFLADLVPEVGTGRSRRERLLTSLTALEAYEDGVGERLRQQLTEIPGVRLLASPARRTPTVLFSVDGYTGDEVSAALAAQGVNAPAGSFYAIEASRWMGLGDDGGVRAGVAPYTDDQDVDRLVGAVRSL